MTFTRPEFLALAALVAVYVLVYLFAGRYRRVRVTYADVWKRAVAKHRSNMLSVLRRLLTIALSVCMLGALVLAAAGPRFDDDGTVDVVVLIDTSPSSARLCNGGETTLRELCDAALGMYDGFGPKGRVWLLYTRRGEAVIPGPWLGAHGDAERARLGRHLDGIEPDFYPFDFSRYDAALAAVGDMRDSTGQSKRSAAGRRCHLVILTDYERRLATRTWPEPFRENVHVHMVGAQGNDAAFLDVTQAGPRSVRVKARGGTRLLATYEDEHKYKGDASGHVRSTPGAEDVLVDLDLPTAYKRMELELVTEGFDPAPWNNRVVLDAQPFPTLEIAFVLSLSDSLDAPDLVMPLAPDGACEIPAYGNETIHAAVVVADGSLDFELGDEVRAVLAIGGLPKQFGRLEESHAGGAVTGILAAPSWLTGEEMRLPVHGIWVSSVSTLHLDETGWVPMLSDPVVGTVMAAKMFGPVAVIYVADAALRHGSPREQMLWYRAHGMLANPQIRLVLRRWLNLIHAQVVADDTFKPPLLRVGEPLTAPCDQPAKIRHFSSMLGHSRKWTEHTCEWTAQPSDGHVVFTDTFSPGEYAVSPISEGIWSNNYSPWKKYLTDSNTLLREAFWLLDTPETQAEMPYDPVAARPLESWPFVRGSYDQPPWWQKHIEQVFLWLALALLLLEWVLYWTNVTD